MINMISVDEVVRLHGVGKIRMLDSFSAETIKIYEKEYTCKILEDLGNHIIKISMPSEYGELVALPLDSTYNMYIETEIGDYQTFGTIIARYRTDTGNVMEFKMTKPLSFIESPKFPEIKTNIQCSYSYESSTDKKIGNITLLSMKHLTMECDELLSEDSRLDIVFALEGAENIVVSGVVKESIRIKPQQFESMIRLTNTDYSIEEELANWMLTN